MIAANPAIEAGHPVERLGHAVVQRGVARGDLVRRDRAQARNACGFEVFAVGVDGAVVRAVVVQLRRGGAALARWRQGCWLVDIAVHHAFSLKRTWLKVSTMHSARLDLLAPVRFAPVRRPPCHASNLHFARRLRPGFFWFFLMDAYFLQSMILLRRAKRG